MTQENTRRLFCAAFVFIICLWSAFRLGSHLGNSKWHRAFSFLHIVLCYWTVLFAAVTQLLNAAVSSTTLYSLNKLNSFIKNENILESFALHVLILALFFHTLCSIRRMYSYWVCVRLEKCQLKFYMGNGWSNEIKTTGTEQQQTKNNSCKMQNNSKMNDIIIK